MSHLLHPWILSFALAAQLTSFVMGKPIQTPYVLEAEGDAHGVAHEVKKSTGLAMMRKLKTGASSMATLEVESRGALEESSKEPAALMRRVPPLNSSKENPQVTQNSSLQPLDQASHFLNVPEGQEGVELSILLKAAWKNGTARGLLRAADDHYGDRFGMRLASMPQASMPLLFLCSFALMASMVHSRSSVIIKGTGEDDAFVDRRMDTSQDTDRVFSSSFLMVLVLMLSLISQPDSQADESMRWTAGWTSASVPCLFTLLGYFLGVCAGRSPKSVTSLQRNALVCVLASFLLVSTVTFTPVANSLLLSRLPWLIFCPLACCIAFMPGLLDCLPDKSCSICFTAVSMLWIWLVSLEGALVCANNRQPWSIFMITYGFPACMHLPEFAMGLLVGRRFAASPGDRNKVVCLIGALGGIAFLILLPRQVLRIFAHNSVISMWLAGGCLSPLIAITSFCLDEVASTIQQLWGAVDLNGNSSPWISMLPIAAPIVMASELRDIDSNFATGARVQGTVLMLFLCYVVEWTAMFLSKDATATDDKGYAMNRQTSGGAQKDPSKTGNVDGKSGSVLLGKFKKITGSDQFSKYAVSSISLLALYWFVFVLQLGVFTTYYSYGLSHLQASVEMSVISNIVDLSTPIRNLLHADQSAAWHSFVVTWTFSVVCFLLVPIVPLTFDLIGQLRFPAVERRPVHTIPRLLARCRKQEDFVMHFRYCTRGTNKQLVNDNLKLAKAVLLESGLPENRWCLEVITDNAILSPGHGDRVSEVVVPESYVCPNGGKYKARALHYAIDARFEVPTGNQDWIIHLDEETQFDVHTVCAMYRHCQHEHSAVTAGRKKLGNIGQGIIVYNYGTVPDFQLAGLADVCRVSGDFGKFRLSYELGRPLIGMHGSFVVCSQAVERLVGFDAGIPGSVTEDTYFALKAWGQNNVQWSFIDGFMFEQSPFGPMDFMKQRGRWFHGIYLSITSPEIPLRCRVFLSMFLLFNTWIQCTLWIVFPVSIAWNMLGVAVPEQVVFMLTLVRTLSNWVFLLGFCMSMTPYTGWGRWLVQLWMTFTLQFCFAFMEFGGVLVGLRLVLTRSDQFHIVQKERPEGDSTTSPADVKGAGAVEDDCTSASSTGNAASAMLPHAASLLQKQRPSRRPSHQAPIQHDDLSSDSDELETDKDLADAAAGPPRDFGEQRADKRGRLWTGLISCARQVACFAAAVLVVHVLFHLMPPPIDAGQGA